MENAAFVLVKFSKTPCHTLKTHVSSLKDIKLV